MKSRNGFVSNSSSTSFIILNKDLIHSGVEYIELNDEQKRKLVEQGYIKSIDGDIYLTEFISDSRDEYYELYDDPDNFENYKEGVIEYHDGGHGGPYNEETYDEIKDNIWLWKG